ncbi:cholecystokinin receptor type A-like [Babylonia areolata]|uniref:cholecystokinin receptor type A-like n=1 Tax=Babylonia areolata TaxID=304850 RepID=UPI003FD61B90
MAPDAAPALAARDSQIPVLLETIHQELEVLIYSYNLTPHGNGSVQEDLYEDVYNVSEGNLSHVPEHEYVVPRISAEIQIVLYTLIFLLAVVGNLLVLITLFQNKRMRTVTNVFLLNLALSDLLLAVFCMPFTLVPVLLRNFIFGAAMCVLIRYLQAVSVGASCFTLVAISLERYFAICRPLHSRTWQTLSHAYRCLVVCWLLAALLMLPVAVFQKHERLPNGAHACRESWPGPRWAQAYTLLLDLALLVLPVLLMSLAYVNVVAALVYDVRTPSFRGGGGGKRSCWSSSSNSSSSSSSRSSTSNSCELVQRSERETEGLVLDGEEGGLGVTATPVLPGHRTIELRLLDRDSMRSISSLTSIEETVLSRSGTLTSGTTGPSSPPPRSAAPVPTPTPPRVTVATANHAASSSPPEPQTRRSGRQVHRIRHSNPRKIRENKIRVIRMLFVVVLEFFLCWTPLYVIQTWMIFDQHSAYEFVTPMTKTLFHLLSYVSSCCNPITYCFMNRKFRECFMRVFTCRRPPAHQKDRHLVVELHSSRGGGADRCTPLVSVAATKMLLQTNSGRQLDYVNNATTIDTIEERSVEDSSHS